MFANLETTISNFRLRSHGRVRSCSLKNFSGNSRFAPTDCFSVNAVDVDDPIFHCGADPCPRTTTDIKETFRVPPSEDMRERSPLLPLENKTINQGMIHI